MTNTPRWITAAEARGEDCIDLGIISAADVYAAGYIELLPAAVGRIITGVRFLADKFDNLDGVSSMRFTSANDVSGGDGFAVFSSDPQDSTVISANQQIPIQGDNGPLGIISSQVGDSAGRILPWTPDTKYCAFDMVLGGGHIQSCGISIGNGLGGTSGSTEPTWDTSGGTTNDGTITWQDSGDTTSGWTATVHAIAEVVYIPGLDISRPTSLEFIQQPTDVVAGENFVPDVEVTILDQFGDPYLLKEVQPDLFVLGSGLFTGGLPIIQGASDPTTGISVWEGISMDVATTPGTYQLMAIIRDNFRSTYFRLASDPFDVTAP